MPKKLRILRRVTNEMIFDKCYFLSNQRAMKSCINRFGQLAGLVKKVKRTGWKRYLPEEKVESVGDHSAKIAFLTLYLRNIENVDYLKCMQMALIHDIAEGIVGDFTPYCNITYVEFN